jgi:uncharacterized protein YegL
MARPGGELSHRPLHFIWIADCSGSMAKHGKIQALNTAIREAIPHMRDVADNNPHAQVLVRAVRFASGARWHVPDATPIDRFTWDPLAANGVTDMGTALRLVAEELRMPPMTDRALPPVLVLISDGRPTDDFRRGLDELLGEPWGRRAVRIAIAIGEDADEAVLQDFIDDPELTPLRARNADELVRYIRWASTGVLRVASQPRTGDTTAAGSVPVPSASSDAEAVW